MTLTEAIQQLKMAVPMRAVTMSEFNDFIEAVNMAIEALEKLPSACNETKQQATISSDLIDRHDAIDAINAYLGLSAVSRTIQNMTSIEEILKNLPSAEPRKKGYWIKKEPTIKELHGCYYECSKCHKFSLPFQKLNFCPNCGADMRGEQDAD